MYYIMDTADKILFGILAVTLIIGVAFIAIAANGHVEEKESHPDTYDDRMQRLVSDMSEGKVAYVADDYKPDYVDCDPWKWGHDAKKAYDVSYDGTYLQWSIPDRWLPYKITASLIKSVSYMDGRYEVWA